MKKKNLVLSLIMLLCVAFYPSVANASAFAFGSSVTISDAMDTSNTTLNENTDRIENNGANTRVYLGVQVTGDTTFHNYKVDLKLGNSNFTFSRGSRSSNWTGTITQDENDPTLIHIDLTNTNGVTAGLHQVATITLNVDSSVESTETCSISLDVNNETTPENPTCEIVDGKYYDDNGVEVTKEEYEEICLNPENPQTGSFLPYAVIIGGIVVAVGLYMFTKKNKIYHI